VSTGRDNAEAFLVGLTSIHWREAWKYGERAFRYCQHDIGHAIGALRFAAALLGWRLALLPRWSDSHIATLLGLEREGAESGIEREEPGCLAIVTGELTSALEHDPAPLLEAAGGASWQGAANRLSAERVDWPIIDAVAAATRYPAGSGAHVAAQCASDIPRASALTPGTDHSVRARDVILQRRSALAFDGIGVLPRERFFGMLRRLRPPAPPWDAITWGPEVHLGLFIHRVDRLTPGLYAYLRDDSVRDQWQAAMRSEFLWESTAEAGLFLLVPLDCRRIARRLSCDQEIAEDGFFSLGMIAGLEHALRQRGEWFYRRLFWECGLIGQVLYVEAEAAGARATGIGCFYDDPVHEAFGLRGRAWQSLYHFSMGVPVEDPRLTSEPGYAWEGSR
jgi:nitroreductase